MGQDRSKKRAQIIDQFTRSEPQLSRFSKGSESFIRSDRPLRFTFFILIHFFRNKSTMSELVDYLRPFLNRGLGPCRGVLSICIFVHKLHDCVTSICCRKTFYCSFVWSHVIWGTYSLRNLAVTVTARKEGRRCETQSIAAMVVNTLRRRRKKKERRKDRMGAI